MRPAGISLRRAAGPPMKRNQRGHVAGFTSMKGDILGVITARGGSKSIPKKSIALLGGYPLLYYTAEAAKRSRLITRLIISTDDTQIAEAARRYDIEVPFLRPGELAQDDTPDLPVFEHALGALGQAESYVPEVVVHLRPTTPLKSADDIDRGIRMILEHPKAESVRSVCAPAHSPFKMGTVDRQGFFRPILTREFPDIFERYREPYNMPRQLLPAIWRHSGYVDVIRRSTITETRSMSGTRILPLFFEEWRDVDIDSPRELAYAEYVIGSLRKQGRESWH